MRLAPLSPFGPENFRGEGFDGRALLPGIRRQAGFAASLLEKGDAVPAVFDRDLRQQQAAASVLADHQSVPSNLHFFRPDRLAAAKEC